MIIKYLLIQTDFYICFKENLVKKYVEQSIEICVYVLCKTNFKKKLILLLKKLKFL